MTSNSEVDPLNIPDTLPSPYARGPWEDRNRIWVENSCRYANVVSLLSALLVIIVATFFSHDYLLTSHWKLFTGSVTTTIALAAKSFCKQPLQPATVLTCMLWLASMTVSLGCFVFSTLLCYWVSRYALAIVDHHQIMYHQTRPAFRGPGAVSALITQYGSVRNVEATLRILRKWLLVAAVLFLWGLDIRLLQGPNPPSPWVILGLSITFFMGLFLILIAS